MSRIPMGGYNPMPSPELMKTRPGAYMGMGETAENVAQKYQITRGEQDALAVKSQQKAAAARAAGKLADEIIPIHTKAGDVTEDGIIRPDTTLEILGGLKPAFDKEGSVTAGTSSPLTDGASAVLVTSAEFAARHGLTVLAKIKAVGIMGCAPETMGLGPIGASKKALERAGITAADLDVVEINEAFASQAIACIRDLGLKDETINIDGGAIAIGHPLGATGARIVGKAASLLAREGGRYALATQCIGGGQGIATVLERA
jgi:acetyl-CoA acyltransferase